MLKPRTDLLRRGVHASLCLAALLLASDFVASTLGQSIESRPQPNSDQQTQFQQEVTPPNLRLRNSTPESPPATSIQASLPASPPEVEDFQTGQKWADGRIGAAMPRQLPQGLKFGHQERRLSSDYSATSTALADPRVDSVPADILPLETSTVLAELCVSTNRCAAWFSTPESIVSSETPPSELQVEDEDNDKKAGEASRPPVKIVQPSKPVDFNQDIYYKNKLEFSFETGWHPVNIPFVYDFAVGDSYNETPLKYTLVPVIASLRWHVDDVGGRWIFRGNFDFTFSASVTLIPRGPETHYFAFIFGVRRNFVYRNWRIVPYFDEQGGVGYIDAKEPLGVLFAQGQNLTFTYNMGTGVRYNLNPRYSLSAGMNYMHISNGYLSEPKFTNYGINVYGPMVGINVRLGKPHDHASE